MNICKYHIFFVLLTTCASFTAISGQPLSNSEAKSIIESSWSKSSKWLPMRGNYAVVSGSYSWGEGTISRENYDDLVILENLGFIEMSLDKRYENYKKGKNFSWDQWMQQAQQRILAKIQLSPTNLGLEHQHPDNPNWLELPMGTFDIKKVIRNEERQVGVDDYRIVMVTYVADWNDDYETLLIYRGDEFNQNRKSIVLLKYDPFNSQWNIVTNDVADVDKDFATNKVAEKLRQLQH